MSFDFAIPTSSYCNIISFDAIRRHLPTHIYNFHLFVSHNWIPCYLANTKFVTEKTLELMYVIIQSSIFVQYKFCKQ